MPPTYAEYLEVQSQLEQQQEVISFERLQQCGRKFLGEIQVKAGSSYFGNCPRDASGHCKPKDTGDETGAGKERQQQPAASKPSSQGQGNTPKPPSTGQGNSPKRPLSSKQAASIHAEMDDFVNPQAALQHGFERGYVTSKGSAYLEKQGGTTRYKKSSGQGQGKIDSHSTGTYYVTPERADKIREIMQDYSMNPTYKASVRSVANDQIAIVIKDRKTEKVSDSLSRVIQVEYDPKVGVSPIEVWDKNEQGEYGFHIGHPIVKVVDFKSGSQQKALSYLDESRGGALVPPPAQGPCLPTRRNQPSVLDKNKLKQLRYKYRRQGILATVESAGQYLAQKWEQLEGRYGRRPALMMAIAMITSSPLPGNIAAIITAAEVSRGIRTYFRNDLEGFSSKDWVVVSTLPLR